MSPADRSTAPITILMADDDEEDRELTRDALAAAHLANPIRFVGDGQFPWNPGRRATLADVRQIGDVVLLRYALSDRFAPGALPGLGGLG